MDQTEQWHRCLEQLAREHRQICWLYRVALPTPVFEISSGRKRAGAWSDRFDCLNIASWLLEEHSWDVVVELLKHEMAHQYVRQVMGQHEETAHGRAFQQACDRLGVHPEFRAAQGSIPRLLNNGTREKTVHPVLHKVEKLFALAKSPNQNEATLAMEKATALLRKHNLRRIHGSQTDGVDYLVIETGKKRFCAQNRTMAALLKNFFYVNVVFCDRFSVQAGETHKVIELTGAHENLLVAEYTYNFLVNRLETLWQEYKKQHKAKAGEKKSYQIGILKGFEEKLRAVERKDPWVAKGEKSSHSSLVCAADPGLVRFYHSRYPRLRSIRRAGPRLRADTFDAGRKEGKNLVLHKGLHSSDGNRGTLLPDS